MGGVCRRGILALFQEHMSEPEPVGKAAGIKGLVFHRSGLLITGGVLLDLDRVAAAREALDKGGACRACFRGRRHDQGDRAQGALPEALRQDGLDRRRGLDRRTRCQRRADGPRQHGGRQYDATVQLVVGRFFGVSEVEIYGEAEVTAPTRQVAVLTP